MSDNNDTNGANKDIAAELTDGHHTMRELYDYRAAYNALLFNEWAASSKYSVVKSKCHADGEPCFGGTHFVVYALTPHGQITNHYDFKWWHFFHVPEVDRAPEYDGHTPQIALERMLATLATAETHAAETHDVHPILKAAKERAEKYADVMHMSKKRTYDQLTGGFDQFPPKAAQYAIEHADIDYRRNTLITAQSYQISTNLSPQGIYEQLVSSFEQFTPEEARYAVDNL